MAGNPPVKFASASFEAENATHQLPTFALFLTRVVLNDFFSIGMLRVTEGLIFAVLYICSLRLGVDPIIGALAALLLTEAGLIMLSVAIKKVLVGRNWGVNHATPFWSLRHFAYFFAQDCFFVWCQGPLNFFAGTILANPILRWMGCQIGQRTIVTEPMQCSDWNAVKFDNDCVVGGFPTVPHLRKYDAEGEANPHPGRMCYMLRRNGDEWRGYRAGHDGIAVVARPQGYEPPLGYLPGQPR